MSLVKILALSAQITDTTTSSEPLNYITMAWATVLSDHSHFYFSTGHRDISQYVYVVSRSAGSGSSTTVDEIVESKKPPNTIFAENLRRNGGRMSHRGPDGGQGGGEGDPN